MRSPVVLGLCLAALAAGDAQAADLHLAQPYARPLAIARVGERQLLLADGRSVRAGRDAAISASGRFAAYSVGGVLRMLDLRSGRRRTVRHGGHGPVWGAGDRLAYAAGERVVVQDRPRAPGRAWTARGHFRPVAWAGGRLFVEHSVPAAYGPDRELRLYDGPGLARSIDGPEHVLGSPMSSLVAVSPDASLAVLSTHRTCINDRVTLLRLGDLAVLDAPRGPQLGRGAWRGDRILAPVDIDIACAAHPDDFLQVLGVRGHRVSGRAQRHVAVHGGRVMAAAAPKLAQPRFLGSRRMAAWFTAINGGTHPISCDLVTLWCRRTPRGGPGLTAFTAQF